MRFIAQFFTLCLRCLSFMSRSRSAGSPPVSSFFQKKIDPSGAKAKVITEHIVNVCVKDLRPFSIVKDAGSRDLIEHAWPTYQIPKRETIRKLIMLRHTEGIKALKSEPENVNINSDVSITTDGWTSITQDSYYTITGKSESFNFELTFFALVTM